MTCEQLAPQGVVVEVGDERVHDGAADGGGEHGGRHAIVAAGVVAEQER